MVIPYKVQGLRRVMAPPPPPAPAIPAPIAPALVAFELVRNLKFDDVRIEHTYQNMWNVCAKVQWKGQVKESAHGHSYLQCILLDENLQAQAQALRHSPISQVNRTTTLIDDVIPTLPPYNIFDSEVYLLPLAVMDAYALLVVNMRRRRTFLMDPCYYPNQQEALIQQSEVMKSRMEPKVQSESVRMLSFLASSDTCRSGAKRYADAVASIARLGHPYISLCFTEDAKPVKLGSSSMKQTLHAEMLADFMWEIERAQLEYASCADYVVYHQRVLDNGLKVIMGGTETDTTDALKEPIDIGSDTMLVEETSFTESTKITFYVINVAHLYILPDYVCTAEDFAVIESIMSAPENTNFVEIGDASLSNDHLKCLTCDDGFLPDDVINAYIYCMRACDHLLNRAGDKVYMDKTYISNMLKKDVKIYRHIIEQTYIYLKHDMIFLPINISKTHWYLAVINAKKRLIQVLDSLGPGMGRSDLTLMLRGLEKHLKTASQRRGFDKGEKWHDLDVTTWPIVEHIRKPLQTDGASCGLFMLNFMEYWTGDMLSDCITQEDMKAFRRKLIAILHDSELNKIRGSPIYNQSKDQENGSDSDITELPSLGKEHLGDVAKENSQLPICTLSTKPHEFVDEICKYIMYIDDATCLKKEWVRSSTPYPLGLTLKQIQDILRMDQPMDKDCFNMAVRIVACDEIQFLIEPPVHNMDLRFCSAILDGRKHPRWRVKPDIKELATFFRSWPGIDHNISSCNMKVFWILSI
ncbi:hypothetical protein ACQ4PT_015072 [Festuca glaucescens]